MAAFTGSVTTIGTSEGFRFEKPLFRQHPEFAQKTKLEASVIGPGMLLVKVVEDSRSAVIGERGDPVVDAFLSFLDRDIMANPGNVRPLDVALMDRISELTRDVVVSDDDVIPDDITL